MYKRYKKLFKEDRRNILPKSFDQWLKKEFNGYIEHFASDMGEMYIEERYPDIKEEYEEMYFETEGERDQEIEDASYKRFYQEQEEIYDDWMWKYKSMSFPMTIYRVLGLKAKSIEDISNIELSNRGKRGIGIYWTDSDAETLEAYWSEGGNEFTIRAEIQEKDINWKDMLYNNMNPSLGRLESEIQLEEGTKINLTGIAKGATVNDKYFEPLNMIVKA